LRKYWLRITLKTVPTITVVDLCELLSTKVSDYTLLAVRTGTLVTTNHLTTVSTPPAVQYN